MSPEKFLKEIANVNPNEKIDTSDDSYWVLKELLGAYDDMKNSQNKSL